MKKIEKKHRDFEAERDEVRDRSKNDWKAVYALRGIEEDWARHLLDLDPQGEIATLVRGRIKSPVDASTLERAQDHLQEAQNWQEQIASYATSGGEGLMYMNEVYELQIARAWVLAALARETGSAEHQALAAELVDKVERAPNCQGRVHRSMIAELHAMLARK